MTLAVGGSSSVQASGTTGTTPGTTTQASGSGFVVDVVWFGAAAAPAITDSEGNIYTQVDTTVNDGGVFGGLFQQARFECVNGIGGASHTATATFASGVDFSCFLSEVTTTNGNGLTRDQHPAGNFTTTSPYTSGSANTVVAAEMALACAGDVAFPGTAIADWSGSSFTSLQSQGDTVGTTGHTAYRALSATGTYAASFVATGAPTTDALMRLTTYYEAAAAAASGNSMFFGSGTTG